MKTIGRLGSGSEYTIFNKRHFVHEGISYHQDWITGRYYRFDTPCGLYSVLNREGRMARRRVSASLFTRLYNECLEKISQATERGVT